MNDWTEFHAILSSRCTARETVNASIDRKKWIIKMIVTQRHYPDEEIGETREETDSRTTTSPQLSRIPQQCAH